MKCAASLERANALVVLAFEEEADLRMGRFLTLVRCVLERFRGLRGRGEGVEGAVCEQRGVVDVGFYERVGGCD
jgi:hypothetical protein